MIIRNGLVFEENKTFVCRDLYVENGVIVDYAEQVTDQRGIDAQGLYVLPGLIDVHSHGAVGYDFSDGNAEGLKEILKYERAHGITSYCPTSMTHPACQLKKIFATAVEAQSAEDTSKVEQADIAGINLEGPFLDPAKKGCSCGGSHPSSRCQFIQGV